ncbi:hypothetical protein O7606_16500 [Micromonospora sp. WMMD882]|uniref:hypothetical protein n=1 Tax=Micromonospora sp. WMMD882 TaxID=3015151 RepID=UPI00248CE12A|nr:hypothetical protein [Micromonospora sp. WMMD882]WBB77866.1 hypothetical protein O7606_16500 [Micromonospora sp. WMMD882]
MLGTGARDALVRNGVAPQRAVAGVDGAFGSRLIDVAQGWTLSRCFLTTGGRFVSFSQASVRFGNDNLRQRAPSHARYLGRYHRKRDVQVSEAREGVDAAVFVGDRRVFPWRQEEFLRVYYGQFHAPDLPPPAKALLLPEDPSLLYLATFDTYDRMFSVRRVDEEIVNDVLRLVEQS